MTPPDAPGLRGAAKAAAPAMIALAVAASYANCVSNAFVFLDVSAILGNPSIRHLGSLAQVLNPPAQGGLTVGGRPLVNLSLALNYAASGVHPWSYHLFNIGVHLAASLLLYGVVRRSLERLGGRTGAHAHLAAFAAALLWAVHPLQTESVTYVIQRAESMMGMFYLGTLYCFIRCCERGRRLWSWLCVAGCLAGMGTKEVMVSAPVIVLLYDRTFVAGTLREALRRRKGLHASLFATWILLAWCVASTGGNRGGTSGFGTGVSPGAYLLTQFQAVGVYLRLAIWPHPLVFFHQARWVGVALQIAPHAAAVALLGGLSLWKTVRNKPAGFLGLFFFAILAPTSLVPGATQTIAEHRMYLALAPCAALAGWAIALLPRPLFASMTALLAIALGWTTAERNRAYADEIALWSDTVSREPDNPYTLNNLGIALSGAGRSAEAVGPLQRAVKLDPGFAQAHNNLGLALAGAGRGAEAIHSYHEAIAADPSYAEAYVNLGACLAASGRLPEATVALRKAVELQGTNARARNNLGVVLAAGGQLDAAADQYRKVIALDPENAEARYNLGNALSQAGDWAGAAAQYQGALALRPAYPEAQANLGVALASQGRLTEALEAYRKAIGLTPDDPDLHYNLALALRDLGRSEEARAQFGEAERLKAGRGLP